MRLSAILAGALWLGACGLPPDIVGPTDPTLPVSAEDTCGGAELQGLVGQPVTALERVLILREIRLIRPGDAVTMDFRPDRLNVYIDESERIGEIRCG